MTIRAIDGSDRNDWNRLFAGYQHFYKVELAADVLDTTFARILDPAEPIHAAFALDETGRPVGLVHWIFHRSTWTVGDYCYLQDLFVEDTQRGRGTGRALIEHVAATAKGAGASRLYWLTHESNHDAITLYDKVAERSGFVQYRRLFA